MTDLRIKGLKATLKVMEQLPQNVNKNATKRAMRKAVKPLRDSARANAPRDSGTLKKAIRSRVDSDREGRVLGVVGVDKRVRGPDGRRPVRYAHLQEFGSDRIRGTAYFERAYREAEPESRRILEDELRREIAKEAAST